VVGECKSGVRRAERGEKTERGGEREKTEKVKSVARGRRR